MQLSGRSSVRLFIILSIFSIAMGYMESAVVIYLRNLYYPGGFSFPLVPIDAQTGVVEFWREAATICMLVCIAILAGRNHVQKFAWFIYCFAIWDLFYYVFLKLMIGWPSSLFTWDILFLIPIPWVGPVIAPCIVSLTMIILSTLIIILSELDNALKIRFREWALLISGSMIIIFSFMLDYLQFTSAVHNQKLPWTLHGNDPLFFSSGSYIPSDFNWWIFFAGEFVIFTGMALIFKGRKSPLQIKTQGQ